MATATHAPTSFSRREMRPYYEMGPIIGGPYVESRSSNIQTSTSLSRGRRPSRVEVELMRDAEMWMKQKLHNIEVIEDLETWSDHRFSLGSLQPEQGTDYYCPGPGCSHQEFQEIDLDNPADHPAAHSFNQWVQHPCVEGQLEESFHATEPPSSVNFALLRRTDLLQFQSHSVDGDSRSASDGVGVASHASDGSGWSIRACSNRVCSNSAEGNRPVCSTEEPEEDEHAACPAHATCRKTAPRIVVLASSSPSDSFCGSPSLYSGSSTSSGNLESIRSSLVRDLENSFAQAEGEIVAVDILGEECTLDSGIAPSGRLGSPLSSSYPPVGDAGRETSLNPACPSLPFSFPSCLPLGVVNQKSKKQQKNKKKKQPHPFEWHGEWEEPCLKKRKEASWQPRDVTALPGVPGKVHMAAFLDHLSLLSLEGALLSLLGLLLISMPVWSAPAATSAFFIALFLLAHGALFTAHTMLLYLSMDGAEVVVSSCYVWLDLCVGFVACASHYSDSEKESVAIAVWLLARGLWIDPLIALSAWSLRGREGWTSLLLVWPPALIGGLLLARQPTTDTWYLAALLGVFSLADGLPLWASCALFKAQAASSYGALPHHLRGFIEQATGTGCMLQGVLRLLPLALLVLAVMTGN